MKKALIAGVAVLLVLVIAGLLWWHHRSAQDNDHVVLNGNVDIRQISLAFDGNGRVLQLRAEEGDQVKAGQVLGLLDTRTLVLQAAQAQAQIDVQQQNLLRLQHGSRPQELAQAKSRLAAAQAPGLPFNCRGVAAISGFSAARIRSARVPLRGFAP